MSDRWQRFGAQQRITTARDYARILRSGRRCGNRFVTAVVLDSNDSVARLGVVVSRKVSTKAVDRNRIKRLIRESFRLHQKRLTGRAVVIIATPKCRDAEPAQLRGSLTSIWAKIEKCVDS